MMGSGVYIRAKCMHGRWHNVDVDELDESSFRRLIVNKLVQAGILVGVKDEMDFEYVTMFCDCADDELKGDENDKQ